LAEQIEARRYTAEYDRTTEGRQPETMAATGQVDDEPLPVGVGRVPEWWMEITPHVKLDLEAEEARMQAETQMAFYYAQMAAADDSRESGPYQSNWAGRGSRGGSGGGSGVEGVMGPGGRKFKSGEAVIDPRMFGIQESDPDYRAYLTGAKLPPGYLERMAEIDRQGGSVYILNNRHQTDFGRYGRQAENPKHQPTWMKMKLKTTSHGQSIRQGEYDLASPKREGRKLSAIELASSSAPLSPPPMSPARSVPEAAPSPMKPEVTVAKPPFPPEAEPLVVQHSTPTAKPKRMVRKVRKIRKGEKRPTSNTPAPGTEGQPPQKEPYQVKTYEQYALKDYYYNATSDQVADTQAAFRSGKPSTRPMDTNANLVFEDSQHAYVNTPDYPQSDDDEEYEEEEYEEEVIEEEVEDEDYEEVEYEEEIVESPRASSAKNSPAKSPKAKAQPDISDLQAILAAKQAELRRLQGLS
jgi:hypothetical protein